MLGHPTRESAFNVNGLVEPTEPGLVWEKF